MKLTENHKLLFITLIILIIVVIYNLNKSESMETNLNEKLIQKSDFNYRYHKNILYDDSDKNELKIYKYILVHNNMLYDDEYKKNKPYLNNNIHNFSVIQIKKTLNKDNINFLISAINFNLNNPENKIIGFDEYKIYSFYIKNISNKDSKFKSVEELQNYLLNNKYIFKEPDFFNEYYENSGSINKTLIYKVISSPYVITPKLIINNNEQKLISEFNKEKFDTFSNNVYFIDPNSGELIEDNDLKYNDTNSKKMYSDNNQDNTNKKKLYLLDLSYTLNLEIHKKEKF